eukprot:snap_masked-scaffold_9-processed-gene-8.46-mRNA-1 protein AED:1.00 eAED:1.00 QI:0/-1/0/0/-1/1/1/0/160
MNNQYISLYISHHGLATYWYSWLKLPAVEILISDERLMESSRNGISLSEHLREVLENKISEFYYVKVETETCSSLLGTRIKYKFKKKTQPKSIDPKTKLWKEQIVFLIAKEFESFGYTLCSVMSNPLSHYKYYFSKEDEVSKPIYSPFAVDLGMHGEQEL